MILASRSWSRLCSFACQKDWRRLQAGTCAGWLLAVACGPSLESPVPALLESLPPLVLEDVRFSGYNGAAQDFEVHAARADLRGDKQLAELSDVDIQFRDSERGPLRVRADRADLNLANDAFVLHENVRGELGDGERFTTSEVRYDDAMRRLYTEQPVRVERGRFSFEGKGMVIDVPSRRLSVNELTGESK